MSFQCPAQFPISRSEGLRTQIKWVNTGTEYHAFDLVVQIGTYDPSTGTFTPLLENYVNDITSNPGDVITTTIDFPSLTDLRAGKYTIVIYLVDWDPTTRQVQMWYDIQGCQDVLVVT
jgi:hypothetical protein